jgi:hypothetical protein
VYSFFVLRPLHKTIVFNYGFVCYSGILNIIIIIVVVVVELYMYTKSQNNNTVTQTSLQIAFLRLWSDLYLWFFFCGALKSKLYFLVHKKKSIFCCFFWAELPNKVIFTNTIYIYVCRAVVVSMLVCDSSAYIMVMLHDDKIGPLQAVDDSSWWYYVYWLFCSKQRFLFGGLLAFHENFYCSCVQRAYRSFSWVVLLSNIWRCVVSSSYIRSIVVSLQSS